MVSQAIHYTTLDIGPHNVPLKVVRDPRAKCMRLSLSGGADHVRLTLPAWVSTREGMRFVLARKTLLAQWWVPPPRWADGDTLLVRGQAHRILWDEALGRRAIIEPGIIRVGGPPDRVMARVRRALQSHADDVLRADVADMAARFNLEVSEVRVANQKARWGSCATGGRLSFNWRLIMVPDPARHYVVAHECAHVRHMNHSPAFWREVVRLGGDLSLRAWFKTHGAEIMRTLR